MLWMNGNHQPHFFRVPSGLLHMDVKHRRSCILGMGHAPLNPLIEAQLIEASCNLGMSITTLLPCNPPCCTRIYIHAYSAKRVESFAPLTTWYQSQGYSDYPPQIFFLLLLSTSIFPWLRLSPFPKPSQLD
jgi:hypothetical protein